MIKIYRFISDIFYSAARRCFHIGDYFELKAEKRYFDKLTPAQQTELETRMELEAEAFAEAMRRQEEYPKAPHLPS